MQKIVNESTQPKKLVFLHGWGMSSHIFHPVIEKMSSWADIVSADLPGYNDNAVAQSQSFSFEEYARLTASQLPDNCVLIGWSLGGLIAQQIALAFPHKIHKLILLCSSPCFVETESWRGIKPDVLNSFKSQLKHDYQKLLNRFLAIQAMGSESARNDVKNLRELLRGTSAPSEATLAQGLEFLHSVDLRDQIGDIQQPTLRIYGSQDSLVPKKQREQIKAYCPNSEKYLIPKASHAPFISHESLFINKIMEFYSS